MILMIDCQETKVADVLCLQGFSLVEAQGAAWVERLKNAPELIVVSERSGPALVKEIRELTGCLIMVLGDGEEYACARFLLEGADAYVSEGMCPKEFLARIEALLRLPERQRAWEREQRAIILNNGKQGFPLKGKEEALWRALEQDAGRYVSREELMRRVWGARPVKPGSLRVYVRQLRNKIGKNRIPAEIINMRGTGYMLVTAPSHFGNNSVAF